LAEQHRAGKNQRRNPADQDQTNLQNAIRGALLLRHELFAIMHGPLDAHDSPVQLLDRGRVRRGGHCRRRRAGHLGDFSFDDHRRVPDVFAHVFVPRVIDRLAGAHLIQPLRVLHAIPLRIVNRILKEIARPGRVPAQKRRLGLGHFVRHVQQLIHFGGFRADRRHLGAQRAHPQSEDAVSNPTPSTSATLRKMIFRPNVMR
jgi:hypothetical protein